MECPVIRSCWVIGRHMRRTHGDRKDCVSVVRLPVALELPMARDLDRAPVSLWRVQSRLGVRLRSYSWCRRIVEVPFAVEKQRRLRDVVGTRRQGVSGKDGRVGIVWCSLLLLRRDAYLLTTHHGLEGRRHETRRDEARRLQLWDDDTVKAEGKEERLPNPIVLFLQEASAGKWA